MGNRSSRPRRNNCCSQRNSYRRDRDKWKRLSTIEKIDPQEIIEKCMKKCELITIILNSRF